MEKIHENMCFIHENMNVFMYFSPFSAYFSPHYIIVEKGLLHRQSKCNFANELFPNCM